MSTRKDNLKQLQSAKLHIDTANNYIAVVANQFSKRAFDAAVEGTAIDSDTLDIQGALSDMLDAINKLSELLENIIQGM